MSQGLRSKLLKADLFEERRICVLSAGIKDVFFYKAVKKDIDLLFVGSFYAYKGLDRFIELLRRIDTPLNVCVVGSGDQEELLNNYIQKTKHKVQVYGVATQEELRVIYCRSRFLVNCSRLESFGLVITEAMACGTPVIATDTDGAREQLGRHNGLIIFGDNENQIQRQLLKTVKSGLELTPDKYKQLQSSVLEDVEKYRLSNISKKLVQLYNSIKGI